MIDPAVPPELLTGVAGVGREPVLVTGATGTLGAAVIDELRRSSVPARGLSRTPTEPPADTDTAGETRWYQGDLGTGAGLDAALDGVQAVVHCASDPRRSEQVDIDGTRRLTQALSRVCPQAHLIHVSILGAQANPLKYYQAKVRAEAVVTSWDGPVSIVRATQFHTLVEQLTHARVGPVGLGVAGLRFAPIDPAYVAGRAVDLALSEPSAEPVDLAGPEILSGREIAVLTARLAGKRPPRMVPIPAVGPVLQAFARGSNLPGPDAERGGSRYAEWLARRLSR